MAEYGTDQAALPRHGDCLAQDSLFQIEPGPVAEGKRWMFDSFMRPLSTVALVAMAGMICHFVACNVGQGEARSIAVIGGLPESFWKVNATQQSGMLSLSCTSGPALSETDSRVGVRPKSISRVI